MDLKSVLEKLRAAGLAIEAVDGQLKVSPSSNLTPEIVSTIKHHKADILAGLTAPTQAVESDDLLDPAERQRLMDACARECSAAYHGEEIDWIATDEINAMIGETFTRRKLISLLNKYKAVFLNGHNSQ